MTTTEWTDSRTPALAIVARGDQIEPLSPTEWSVRSQSHPEVVHKVSVLRSRWGCTCPYHAETQRTCIHILSVRFREGFREKGAPKVDLTPSCERCQSGNVVRAGTRRNKSGAVKRYECRACGYTYSGKEGYHRRRADPDKIATACDLYFRGVSLRQIADHFVQKDGLKLSPMTVYRWITHYSALAAEWMNAQGAKVGEKWNVDETMVSIDGDKSWVWNAMDSETRFLLATHVSRSRTMRDTRAVFQKAKQASDVVPKEIRTDGMPAYPYAIQREYGRWKRPGDPASNLKIGSKAKWSPHVVVPSIRAAESNNIVERLNGSQRDRTRPMRGYDTQRGCAALTEGWRVNHNLVRTHLSLGTTPGVAAGLPPIDGFKWRAILDMAVHRKVTGDEEAPSTAV